MSDERELLIEQATAAWRPEPGRGGLRGHPAWYDLDDEGRREVFERTRQARAMEAALDPEGLSTTGRAVLARIREASGQG